MNATKGKHLKALRQAAGLSLRDLEKIIGERHSTISYWETTGKLPRSEVVVPLAKALGVSVEELLGEEKPKRSGAPAGKVRQTFEKVSKLPRRQQDKILDVINALLNQHHNKAA